MVNAKLFDSFVFLSQSFPKLFNDSTSSDIKVTAMEEKLNAISILARIFTSSDNRFNKIWGYQWEKIVWETRHKFKPYMLQKATTDRTILQPNFGAQSWKNCFPFGKVSLSPKQKQIRRSFWNIFLNQLPKLPIMLWFRVKFCATGLNQQGHILTEYFQS